MAPTAESVQPMGAAPRWRDTLLLAAAVLVACVVLTRGIWHGLDAYDWLGRIEQGPLINDRHPLYLPLTAAVARPLLWLGVPLLHAAAAASALGVALGTGAVHRALAKFGLQRRDAAVATLAATLCFGLLYFGTVVEIHGVYFAATGAAWWSLAQFVRHPRVLSAVAVGAISGLGAAIHATGHLLPLPLLLIGRCGVCLPARKAVACVAALLLAHAVVAFGLTRGTLWWLGANETAPFAGSTGYLDRMLSLGTDWRTLGGVLWREWLQPFLPISVLSLAALLQREHRRPAVALVICVAVYTAAAVVLLSPATTVARPQYLPPFATIEYGAYFLPLLVPAAVLSLRALPWRAWPLVPVLCAAWAAANLVWSDRRPGDLAYANDALAVIDERRAHLLCGGYDEIDGLMQLRPTSLSDVFDARPGKVLPVYAMYVWLASMPPDVPFQNVTAWFDLQCQQAQAAGGVLLITDGAVAIMRATRDGLLDRLVDEHLPAHYALVRVEQGRFRGVIVAPKN